MSRFILLGCSAAAATDESGFRLGRSVAHPHKRHKQLIQKGPAPHKVSHPVKKKLKLPSLTCDDVPMHNVPCDNPPALVEQVSEDNTTIMSVAEDLHAISKNNFIRHTVKPPAQLDAQGCPTCPAVFNQNKGAVPQDCRCWNLTSDRAVRHFHQQMFLWNNGRGGAAYCACPTDNYEAREGWGSNCANREPIPNKLVRGSMRLYLASKESGCGCCCRLAAPVSLALTGKCKSTDAPELEEVADDGTVLEGEEAAISPQPSSPKSPKTHPSKNINPPKVIKTEEQQISQPSPAPPAAEPDYSSTKESWGWWFGNSGGGIRRFQQSNNQTAALFNLRQGGDMVKRIYRKMNDKRKGVSFLQEHAAPKVCRKYYVK